MTLREKLADLISGGALTRARADVAWWRDHMIGEFYGPMVDEKNAEIIRIQKNNALLHDNIEKCVSAGAEIYGREVEAKDALRTIAAMETPSANATVKRMAKTAREALGE